MKWLKRKAQEISSWLGIGLILNGVTEIAKISETQGLGDQIINNADELANGNFAGAIASIIVGLVGVWKNQKEVKDSKFK